MHGLGTTGDINTLPVLVPSDGAMVETGLSIIVALIDSDDSSAAELDARRSVSAFSELCKKAELGAIPPAVDLKAIEGNVNKPMPRDSVSGLDFGASLDTEDDCAVDGDVDVDVVELGEMTISTTANHFSSPKPMDADITKETEGEEDESIPRAALSHLPVPVDSASMSNSREFTQIVNEPINFQPVVHIIDITIEGKCDWNRMFPYPTTSNSRYASQSMGCFVTYRWPCPEADDSMATESSNSVYNLWYDAECHVLNGSKRHRVSIRNPRESLLESVFLSSAEGVLSTHETRTLDFYLVHSDIDGALPARSENRTVFGHCQLLASQVASIFEDVGGTKTVDLPITLLDTQPRQAGMVSEDCPTLSISLYHRQEPLLTRSNSKLLQDVMGRPASALLHEAPKPIVFEIPDGVVTIVYDNNDNDNDNRSHTEAEVLPLSEDLTNNRTILHSEDIQNLLPSFMKLLESGRQQDSSSSSPSSWQLLSEAILPIRQQETPPMLNEYYDNSFHGESAVNRGAVGGATVAVPMKKNMHLEMQLEVTIECVRDISEFKMVQHQSKTLYFVGTCGLESQVVRN